MEAVAIGVAAASCAVGVVGSQAAYPTRMDLEAMRGRVTITTIH